MDVEREREREPKMELVRLPNGDQEVMGSTPTFHQWQWHLLNLVN